MSLSRLIVKGFQAHRRLVIRFGRVTSIIGRTDVGKSAALRAIWWLCANRPAGGAFVRRGGSTAVVRLDVGDHVVRRVRGPRRNVYELDGRTLEGFGSDVPEDVRRVLNVGGLSYQGQHDRPFWIGDSAADVSRQVNEIVDLAIVDRVLSRLGAACRRLRAKEISLHSLVLERKKTVVSLRPVRVVHKNLRVVEEIAARQIDNATRVAALGTLVQDLISTAREIEDYKTALSVLEGLKEKARVLANLHARETALARLVVDMQRLLPLLAPVPDLREVENIHRELSTTQARRQGLLRVVDQYNELTRFVARGSARLERMQNQFAKGIRICPLCGRTSQATQEE